MKKPLRILISLLICLLANGLYSQEFNKIYYGIVSDSTSRNHYIEFKNDSIVELISIPRHMQPQSKTTFSYFKKNGTIIIKSNEKIEQKADGNNQGKFSHFSENTVLEINEKALTDNKNKVIYVFLEDFKKKHYITYIINGKEFKQESLMTNSYGLIDKKARMNRKLERKLKTIKSDLEKEKYNIVVYKGLDAYLKFGYDKVMGVIELNRK